jgi:hypothetical protein
VNRWSSSDAASLPSSFGLPRAKRRRPPELTSGFAPERALDPSIGLNSVEILDLMYESKEVE